jgi:hypothetical protein
VSEEFTGKCFHTWRVRLVDDDWRVAAQMVERFTDPERQRQAPVRDP